ncbi:MAG: hypothetical protein QF371_08995, partial [Flavobacteriales bacterium]|nr:hypothetical protein [Flavobacteriales bacterium]
MFRINKPILFSALTVVLLAIAVCFRFYGNIILHPGEFLFGAEGDGLKNYFSVAYQVVHGEDLWFKGMLYPYGDHLLYADGQPFLSKILSWFIDPEVNNGIQVIAAMNLLMVFSLVITAWCIHRLLVWNLVNPWFAVPFSLLIAFLSPQIARFGGHYALAYTFFIPITWLLLSAIYIRRYVWFWTGLFVLFTLLFGFIQPYYIFISTVFLGAVVGWEIIINRFRFREINNVVAKLAAIIIPLFIFILYQKSVSVYTDRPCCPGGIFSFMATFQSVFVPVKNPFYGLFNNYFFRLFTPSSWEGHAYIGLVP